MRDQHEDRRPRAGCAGPTAVGPGDRRSHRGPADQPQHELRGQQRAGGQQPGHRDVPAQRRGPVPGQPQPAADHHEHEQGSEPGQHGRARFEHLVGAVDEVALDGRAEHLPQGPGQRQDRLDLDAAAGQVAQERPAAAEQQRGQQGDAEPGDHGPDQPAALAQEQQPEHDRPALGRGAERGHGAGQRGPGRGQQQRRGGEDHGDQVEPGPPDEPEQRDQDDPRPQAGRVRRPRGGRPPAAAAGRRGRPAA